MFCKNCGNQLNDNARFCPSCGAPANGAPAPQMAQEPMMAPPASGTQASAAPETGGSALPPGIERLEDGTLYWTYYQSLWSNPTILYTLLKVMAVAVLIVMVIIGGIGLMEGSFEPLEMLIIGGGLAVGMTVLSLIGYAVYAAVSGGEYGMLFFMNDTIIVHMAMPKEAKRGDRISDMAVLVGALTGNLTLAGMGLANRGRNAMESKFAEVKSITQDRAHDLIKVRSGFEFNQIYAAPAQYDFVLSHIASHCPGAKVE